MDASDPFSRVFLGEPRCNRRLRFMESADINAAFRAVFGALRTAVRRGMSVKGELYAIEMDACLPGELLGTDWLPVASRGLGDPAALADVSRRQALYRHLFAEERPEALFAYVCERPVDGGSLLYVEIVSRDGCHAAEYPIEPGSGWHVRELLRTPHRRVNH